MASCSAMPASTSSAALIHLARNAFETGVRAVHPDTLMPQHLGNTRPRRIQDAQRVYVATIGKAAVPWGRWWMQQDKMDAGVVVAPEGYDTKAALPQRKAWQQVEAGHPHPTPESARAGRLLLDMAARCTRNDVLVVGLSGGGSACTAYPPAGVSMQEVRVLNEQLLRSGLPIDAVNAVRKHVLQVGGGRLAAAAYPGHVWCQVISDVPGNDLSTIASGPTVGDPTTYTDAIDLLRDAEVWNRVPASIQTHLQEGARGTHPETVAPGDTRLSHTETSVIATNHDACMAAASHLSTAGYEVQDVVTSVEGRAREVGHAHAQQLRHAEAGTAFVWGGESTVEVTGFGTGGRNQEAALAGGAALAEMDTPAVLFCAGTDGIDGPTDAAGAWVTPTTHAKADAQGRCPEAYLSDNDSYTFFKQVGGLYQPGPTGTNVMDVHIGLVGLL